VEEVVLEGKTEDGVGEGEGDDKRGGDDIVAVGT
jgi:hypothetical protein